MYLQREIEDAVWAIKPKLEATVDLKKQSRILSRMLKQYKATLKLVVNRPQAVRGSYDPNNGKITITVERLSVDEQFDNVPKFLFDLNCTIQHELIHQYQWLHRDVNVHSPRRYRQEWYSTMQEYLSSFDEIEAQAHDAVMEIKYFYPGICPKVVLTKYLDAEDVYLPTVTTYMNAFAHQVSHPVMRRFFRKLFVWMPQIEIARTITYRGD